jgi:putative aldouronate transport system substrate-binding protein
MKTARQVWSKKYMLGLVFTIMLTACSSGSAGTAGTTPGTSKDANEPPTEISMINTYYSLEPPDKDNVVLKEIEKRTNTKLNITWVSSNNYNDRVSVVLASGDIPDLLAVTDPYQSQVRQTAKQGAFWDVTDIIKNYPNLMKVSKDALTLTKMEDGKNYGVPRAQAAEGSSFPSVRKDWLDKLGLKVPKTMDEVYAVMKAFAANDMAGGGKTIAAIGNVDPDNMAYFSWPEEVYNKAFGNWKLVDGKLVNINLLPGTKQSLEFLRKAYVEKLIPADFAVLKRSQLKDMQYAGINGIMKDQGTSAWRAMEQLKTTVPDAYILPLVDIDGFTPKDSGVFGMFVIPKKVPEKKMKKIMEFLEYGATKEGNDLANYGIKGVHYTENNGLITTTEQAVKDNVSPQAMGQVYVVLDPYSRAYAQGIPKDFYELNKKIIDDKAKISSGKIDTGLYSETDLKVGAEIRKKIQDMKTQVILGKKQMSDWDAFVEQLKADKDLMKITQELNESYQKRLAAK